MKGTINKISFGIRMKRSFKVADRMGEIVDSILADEKDSPFIGIFTEVGSINNGKLLLSDNMKLSLDFDGLIMSIDTKDIEKTMGLMKEKYLPYISKHIFQKYNIQNI